MPSLLITGASGFVGTTAREYFKDRYETSGLDRVSPYENFASVRDYKCDLLDPITLYQVMKAVKPEYVLHLAAQARVEPSVADPIGTYKTNVEGTINLLEQCVIHHVKRLIYASSEAIYGNADNYPTKESDHFRPISPYAASKIAGDVMVQQFRKVETVVIRSGMGFGPRSPPEQVVTKFMLRAMDNKELKFPVGPVVHPTRDVNYIGNWMQGIDLVLQKKNPSPVYNLGSGYEYSLPLIAQEVIRVVGKGRIVTDPDFKYREGEEGMRTFLDNTRARDELGYYPMISFRQGLGMTYSWLLENRYYFQPCLTCGSRQHATSNCPGGK